MKDKSAVELKEILQECKDGKYGDPAAEVKVAILSFQEVAPGTCPYVCLLGMPQSINASNDFGSKVMDACKAGAKKAGNVAVLNTSTDGVASEVQWNLKVTQDYLDKKKNDIASTMPGEACTC